MTDMINRLELEEIITDKYGNEELFYMRSRNKNGHTPMRFAGMYKLVGLLTIWDSVGNIVEEIQTYCPKKGGSVVYLVEA